MPLSPYGLHKMFADHLIRFYSQTYALQSCSLRIFSAYGEGQKKLLLWDLHRKIQNSDGKVTLSGTGNESRDYIHVIDIAQQILLTIKHATFAGESINIANGIEVKISDIVGYYAKYYPKKFSYEFNGVAREGDPNNWRADIRTMNDWGYEQSVNIEEGIRNYINWAITQ